MAAMVDIPARGPGSGFAWNILGIIGLFVGEGGKRLWGVDVLLSGIDVKASPSKLIRIPPHPETWTRLPVDALRHWCRAGEDLLLYDDARRPLIDRVQKFSAHYVLGHSSLYRKYRCDRFGQRDWM
ncbi:MAG: hypothetical protein KJ638_00015 [Chloroflexi bacterium]|nr:hypothetical protein [Chloroflexota bacterium]